MLCTYMDLCCCLRVKERFNGIPQHPESRTGIDDEHAVQGLSRSQQFTPHHSYYVICTENFLLVLRQTHWLVPRDNCRHQSSEGE